MGDQKKTWQRLGKARTWWWSAPGRGIWAQRGGNIRKVDPEAWEWSEGRRKAVRRIISGAPPRSEATSLGRSIGPLGRDKLFPPPQEDFFCFTGAPLGGQYIWGLPSPGDSNRRYVLLKKKTIQALLGKRNCGTYFLTEFYCLLVGLGLG